MTRLVQRSRDVEAMTRSKQVINIVRRRDIGGHDMLQAQFSVEAKPRGAGRGQSPPPTDITTKTFHLVHNLVIYINIKKI
jgi:hypothetical protein